MKNNKKRFIFDILTKLNNVNKLYKRFENLFLSGKANIKGYCYIGLLERKSDKIFNFLLNELNNTETLENRFGCLTNSTTLNCFLLERSIDYLTVQQISILDSILFTSCNPLFYNRYILEKIDTNRLYYEMVKKAVISNRNEFALIGLARYQKNKM
ncbi:MAG: hypothetical protein HY738_16370 [Bacteroidia bacterium]|nr:hypothetical protein [Bacteroidia bacterium]